jgi:predicted AAA+ superfamily ATPase
VYLDLESERDRAKLDNAELYLSDHLDKLVILDEVHRAPALFPLLRGLIDQARRRGKTAGQYLLLGSASWDLLQQSGETLAGRISYLDMTGLTVQETGADQQDSLWLRGGFPDSLRSPNEARSLRWRESFIRTYLERDIPQFGPRIPAETLRRLWTMLAHHQGGLLNVAQLARNIGVDAKTAASYIDLLSDLLLVRRLAPWHDNQGKRLVKSPKVYVRDSGLVHALLRIGSKDDLLSHPVVGASWEGFCIENLLACAPRGVQAFFYRSSGGAEVDLLLLWPNGERWAIEIKRSTAPKVERGFHSACEDLQPARKRVVYPGQESYRLREDVHAVSLHALCQELLTP